MDGKLSFSEFLGEESHIERIFKSMDINNDGFVSKQVLTNTIVIISYRGIMI